MNASHGVPNGVLRGLNEIEAKHGLDATLTGVARYLYHSKDKKRSALKGKMNTAFGAVVDALAEAGKGNIND